MQNKEFIIPFIVSAQYFIGQSYNDKFDSNGKDMYCSQLVLKSLENIGCYPFTILQETPMTFKDKNGEIPNILSNYIKK